MATQSFLPQDIVEDILTKLPVKTLLRFKCLSKHYCSFIDSSSFISAHLRHSIKNPSLLALSYGKTSKLSPKSSFHSSETIISDIFTPFIENPNRPLDPLRIVGCCHGMVCYEYYERDSSNNTIAVVVLWNPATRKFKILLKYKPQNRFRKGLGFGFDPRANDYKFVYTSFYGQYTRVSIRFKVFERNKSCWRQINYDNTDYVWDPRQNLRLTFNSKAFAVQGALYWNIDDHMLLSFSLLDDSFQWISFPPPLNRCMTTDYNDLPQGAFCAWKESVAAIVHEPFLSPDKHFDIWALNGIGKDTAWSKLFTVTPLKFRLLKPLCIWKDREAVFGLLRTCFEDKLFGLDIYSGAAKPHLLIDNEENRISGVWTYEESLVLV